ncbi:retrovirus-related pol polyprotein from transposon TNT 1-94 [Tanacetum coccineum]
MVTTLNSLKYFDIQKKELYLDNDRLLEHIICQDVVNIVMHADDKTDNVLTTQNNLLDDNIALDVLKMENDRLMELLEVFQIREWQDRLQAKDVSIDKLKKHIENLKGKSDVESAKTVKITNVIPSKVYTLDFPPLCPRLKNNREAHVYYLKFVSNSNFKPICVTYSECMFDNVHDSCVVDFINDMNVIGKSKPVKAKSGRSNKKEWKPTRKIFSSVGYSWEMLQSKGYTMLRVADTICSLLDNFGTLNQIAKQGLARAQLFLWAEAVNTACYTQNRSLIRLRYNKTPYELMHEKKTDLSYLHVFGSLCYPTNDSEDLGKLKAKANIGIFVGYDPIKKAFRIYNKRTRLIMETIHVTFDALTAMASEKFSSRLAPNLMTLGTSSLGLVPNPSPQPPYVPPTKSDWDLLFLPMFDEYFNPPLRIVSPYPVAAAPRVIDPAGSPLSTSINQDAPSLSTS